MAIQLLKEVNRLPGCTIAATGADVIMSGNMVELTANPSMNEIQIWDGPTLSPSPLGFVLDNPLRSTLTNQLAGAQAVTEYNRGGLVGIGVGAGAVYKIYSDPTVDLNPATGARINPLDTTVVYAVNNWLYAKDAAATTGDAQYTSAAGATNFPVGRIIRVEGTGATLAVTIIAVV